jgi:hypothetical protein
VWFDDTMQVGRRLRITPGVRFDWSVANGRALVSPRIAATFLLDSRTRLRAAGGMYAQSPGYEKLVTADYVVDLQDAAEKGILHERSWMGILGIERDLGAGFSVSLEGYARNFRDLIVGRIETEQERLERVGQYDFPDELQSSIPTAPIITSNPSNGASGTAYGLDLMLAKRPSAGSNYYGWVSYSWGSTTQQAYGRRYAFDYDRQHAASGVLNWHFARKWEFGVSARWSTGFPYTPPVGVRVAAVEDPDWDPDSDQPPRLIPATDPNGNLVYQVDVGDISNINTTRLPDYARIDARITFRPGGLASNWETYLEVLNITGRNNAGTLEASLEYNPNGPEPTIVLAPGQALPLIPTFGVRFRF